MKALGISCRGKELLPVCGELNPGIIREAFFPAEEETEKQDEAPEQGQEQADKRANVAEATPFPVPGRPPVMCAGCPHRGCSLL